MPLYLLVESYYDPHAIKKINDIFANVIIGFERLITTRELRKDIASFLGDVKGKTMLEIGCSDIVTLELLNRVGTAGKVYIIHFSEKHLKIIEKHARKNEWETEGTAFGRLISVEDSHYYERIHPSIKKVDGVVSVGMLGYIQNIENVLRDLKNIIPLGGKVVFAEYSNFFHLLPEVDWLGNNKQIEALFRKHGFSVRIEKKKRILWNTIYLYGIRYSEDVAFI